MSVDANQASLGLRGSASGSQAGPGPSAAAMSFPRLLASWGAAPGGSKPYMPGAAYAPVDPRRIIPGIVTQFRRHAFLVWAICPIFVVFQTAVPGLQPTCDEGYSDLTMLGLVLVILHHVYSESCAWAAVKDLLTPPEITIMRQHGVLRKRKWMVLLGILEDLSLYANLTFPLVARSCRLEITEEWFQSWRMVPIIGHPVAALVRHLRFWGSSAILALLVTLVGVVGLWRLFCKFGNSASLEDAHHHSGLGGPSRVAGSDFFTLARQAEAALMPSVAMLCEEMGLQRRWVYHAKAETGGVLGFQKAREDVIYGKMPVANKQKYLEKFEIHDHEESSRIDSEEKMYQLVQMTGKVFIANALQLWLQAQFFELSFHRLGNEAMFKLTVGMFISCLQVLVRSADGVSKTGFLGCVFAFLSALAVAWAAAMIYYAFQCDEHIWNLTTGCVVLHGSNNTIEELTT